MLQRYTARYWYDTYFLRNENMLRARAQDYETSGIDRLT